MISKIFSPKNRQKLAFLTQNKAKLYNILIITLVFEKNANFLSKIVIITSTPDGAISNPKSNFGILVKAWN
jgi:hypothetical protein